MIWERLRERIAPTLMKWFRCREDLSREERVAENRFFEKLVVVKSRLDPPPVVVALIGLVGSGKSYVAKHLAEVLGATIVSGDDIRVELRKQGAPYEKAYPIAENAMIDIISRGGNVIMDSDFIDWRKRASLMTKARELSERGMGIDLYYVRVYCDPDVVVGRIISSAYAPSPDDFFGGALSKWEGDEKLRGAAVKIREMWRRTPQHYRWVRSGGGKWVLKNLPIFTPYSGFIVDTTKGGDLMVGWDIRAWKSIPC